MTSGPRHPVAQDQPAEGGQEPSTPTERSAPEGGKPKPSPEQAEQNREEDPPAR
jgi:hypothetical protein